MLLQILGAALCVMLVSLVGVVFAARPAERFLHTRLSYLVAFSSGVFLVTGGALALEVFHIYEDMIVFGIFLIVCGYIAAWLVERSLPESHHHHDPADHGHHHGKVSARKVLIGDALHNIGDGIMLVPAFLASPALGLAVTVSIVIHETLQEISEFFVLKQAGYTTRRALALNFLAASTVLVGVVLAYVAVQSHELEGVLLAVSAGFFLHVVIHDLLPRREHHASLRDFLQHVVLVLCGVSLMATVTVFLEGSHSHESAPGEHQGE